MKSTILFTIVLLLLAASPIIFPGHNLNAAAAESDYIHMKEEASYLETLPFERMNVFWDDNFVFHPNNKAYYLYQSNTEYTSIGIGYGNVTEDRMDIIFIPLDIDSIDKLSLRGRELTVSEGGDLLCFIWWEEPDDQYQYDGAIVTIKLNDEGTPIDSKISLCEMEHEPEKVHLFEIDGVPYAYMYHVDELLIFKGEGDSAEKISLDKFVYDNDILTICPFGSGFVIFDQIGDGRLMLAEFSKDMSCVRSLELKELPEGIGMDSHLSYLKVREDLYLFAYLEETFEDIYSDIIYFRVSKQMEILNEGYIHLPEGNVLRGSFEPFLLFNNITLMEGEVRSLLVWNPETNGWKGSDLNTTHLCNDLFHADLDMELISLGGETGFVVYLDGHPYGTSFIKGRSSIPPLGDLVLDGDWRIVDSNTTIRGHIAVYGNLTIQNSNLLLSSSLWMMNYGNLFIDNSTIDAAPGEHSSRIYNTLKNYGTTILKDSSLFLSVYNEREDSILEITGNCLRRDADKGWVYINGGRVSFLYTTFRNLDDINAPLRVFTSSYEKMVLLKNCRIEGSGNLFLGIPSFWEMRDCHIINWTGTYYGNDPSVSKIESSFFYGSNTIEIADSGEVVNSTFIGSGPVKLGKGCIVKNSTFRSCNEALIDSDRPDEAPVTIMDCRFTDCNTSIGLQYQDGVIEGCTFSRVNISVKIDDKGGETRDIVIRGCSFDRYAIGISIPIIIPGGMNITIKDNYFGQGEAAIHIVGAADSYMESFRHGRNIWDEVYDKETGNHYRIFDHQFWNAALNRWDTNNPEDVASRISPFIYFLPFYDSDGNLISTDDNDMDGMSDSWERRMGLDPTSLHDRYLDEDGDKYSNYEEYKEGTDPLDEKSNPAVEIRTRLVFFEILFALLPLTFLVCHVFYLQIALAGDERSEFRKKYWYYHYNRKNMEKSLETPVKPEFMSEKNNFIRNRPRTRVAVPAEEVEE